MNYITVKIEGGLYAVRCVDSQDRPVKDLTLVESLKSRIPKMYRAWNPGGMAWLVDPRAVNHCKRAIEVAGYNVPEFPPMTTQAIAAATQRTFKVEYIGACKERDGGEVSALATLNAQRPAYNWDEDRPFYEWPVEFPEAVLKDFFAGSSAKTSKGQTYYQVLCVVETATDEQIKTAFRRLARQWHPDVCREEDAAERFREITDAHDVLRDPVIRRRYDVGLSFERDADQRKAEIEAAAKRFTDSFHCARGQRKWDDQRPQFYRAPLRCGSIVVEGVQGMRKFKVAKILSWDDITDAATGKVMSTSWSKVKQGIEVTWL